MSILDGIEVAENDDVDYFSYRRAQVPTGGTISEVLMRADYVRLENQLAKAAGVKYPDNHVVYGIITPGGEIIYMWFHDDRIYVGSTYRLTGE